MTDTEKALAVEAETKEQFPLECRVMLSDHGRERTVPRNHLRIGTVKKYAWGGNHLEGVSCRCCLYVLWDGRASVADAVHRSWFVRVPE